MLRSSPAARGAALFVAAAAAAVVAAAPARAGGRTIALRKGDVAQFDLSALPERHEGQGTASCAGSKMSAIGPTKAECKLSFTFALPPGAATHAYVFRGAKGGEVRIELPSTRGDSPRAFTAPSDGTLEPVPTPAISREEVDRAASGAAARQCAACTGGTDFELEKYEITKQPGGGAPITIRVVQANPR